MKAIVLFLSIFVLVVACNSKSNYSKDPLFNALLNENWQNALNLVENEYKDSESPVYRAIKGHVFLANNRNNESLEMFFSLSNEADKNVWVKWTTKFKEDYKKNATALYLNGDAHARKGNWQAAMEKYNVAEKLAHHKLTKTIILNALGVAHATNSQFDKADKFLMKAINLHPGFADTYASLGTIFIKRKAAAGAQQYFESALKKSNDFALAINGLGCAHYGFFNKDQLLTAVNKFQKSAHYSVTNKLAMSNLFSIYNIPTSKNGESAFECSAGTSITAFGKQGSLKEWSNQELKSAIRHNDKVGRVFDMLPDIKIGGSIKNGKEKGPNAHGSIEANNIFSGFKSETHKNRDAQIAELKRRGVEYKSPSTAGGLKTWELEEAMIDNGVWKVNNWFGLAQSIH